VSNALPLIFPQKYEIFMDWQNVVSNILCVCSKRKNDYPQNVPAGHFADSHKRKRGRCPFFLLIMLFKWLV
jgi:hypothetical protein